MIFSTGFSLLVAAVLVMLPAPDVTGSQWAEEYRVLSAEDSGAPGRWDLGARPYQSEIMDCAADLVHEFTTVVGPSQWGKTAVGLNILGRIIHIDPGPVMVVHPTIAAAQKWSKTRFAPMVRDCPVLTALVSDSKSRSKSNTILEKVFRAGLLVNVGANAPAGLASQPVKYLIFEETDRVPIDVSAGNEGDYEALAIARTTDANFIKIRKIYRSSSPTFLGASRIERAWNESDQRYWFFLCPHCGHEQRLFWENVSYSDAAPEHPVYGCSGAGCEITDPELRRAVRQGHWVATRPWILNHAGFWIHGLMVREMAYIVAEFLEARKGGIKLIQTWKNTCLGVLFNTREGEEAQAEGLLKRAREANYHSGQVPDGVGLLVASVDVQTANPQRLEVLVRGYGAGQEAWTIRHHIIPGNLALTGPWDELQEFLLQEWPRVSGGTMRVRSCALDFGGNFGRQVNAFRRRPKVRSFLYPTKGNAKPQRGQVRKANTKALLYLMDTVSLKDEVFATLKVTVPGPGFQNFPSDTDQSYFDQLLSEHPGRSKKTGRRDYQKHREDDPNEVLDLHVMCAAALVLFNPKDLAGMAARVAEQGSIPHQPQSEEIMATEDDVEPTPEAPAAEPPQAAPAPAVRVIRPKGRPAAPTTILTAGIPLATLRGAGGGSGGSGAW